MRQKIESISDKNIAGDECHHYWKIEGSNNPTSMGVCKYCGAEKEFLNHLPDFAVIRRNSKLVEMVDLPEPELPDDKCNSEVEKADAALPV